MFPHYPVLLLCFALRTVRSDSRNPLTAPKPGEVVAAEKPYTIRWTAGSPGPVKIWLAYGNTDPVGVSDWIPNVGTYGWVPSQSYAGRSDYFVAICDTANVAHDCTNSTEFVIALLASGTSSSVSSTFQTSISSSSATVEPSISASSSPTDATASPSASEPAATQSPSSHSTLSPGAKIAIGTVIGLVGAGLFGIAAIWFWYKRRHRDEDSTVDGFDGGVMRPVLHVGGAAEWSRPAELPTRGFPHT